MIDIIKIHVEESIILKNFDLEIRFIKLKTQQSSVSSEMVHIFELELSNKNYKQIIKSGWNSKIEPPQRYFYFRNFKIYIRNTSIEDTKNQDYKGEWIEFEIKQIHSEKK